MLYAADEDPGILHYGGAAVKRSRKLAFAALLLLLAAVGSAGWVFMRTARPTAPNGGWQTEFSGGRTSVNVWRASGTAESAATAREAEYRADGWISAPVCTPTFKLMLRDGDLAAVLAEDLPGGVTVTELVRRGVL